MAFPRKIATCCYCGTRAMLTVDRDHHTLSCENCGAPLRDLKMLQGAKSKVAISHQSQSRKSQKKRKKKGRKKRSWAWYAEEAWDFVEDIFD